MAVTTIVMMTTVITDPIMVVVCSLLESAENENQQ